MSSTMTYVLVAINNYLGQYMRINKQVVGSHTEKLYFGDTSMLQINNILYKYMQTRIDVVLSLILSNLHLLEHNLSMSSCSSNSLSHCIVSASGRLTFAEVEKFVRKRGGIYTKSEEECDIIEAFKVLDKDGTGKISIRDFRRCMTTLGDKMSDEEVEEILHFAKTKDGEFINYAGKYLVFCCIVIPSTYSSSL